MSLGSKKAEGIVVKPLRNIMAINKYGEPERVIIKLKIETFSEIQHGPKKKEKGKAAQKGLLPISQFLSSCEKMM